MLVHELSALLAAHPQAIVAFQLPSGEAIPAHFHVTEVGRVHKRFIDCGGSTHESVTCLLQTWTADDVHHRLDAAKLHKILLLAAPLLGSDQLPVEVEYGLEVAAQYTVTGAHADQGRLRLQLSGKQTDCLAKEKCLPVLGCGPGCC